MKSTCLHTIRCKYFGKIVKELAPVSTPSSWAEAAPLTTQTSLEPFPKWILDYRNPSSSCTLPLCCLEPDAPFWQRLLSGAEYSSAQYLHVIFCHARVLQPAAPKWLFFLNGFGSVSTACISILKLNTRIAVPIYLNASIETAQRNFANGIIVQAHLLLAFPPSGWHSTCSVSFYHCFGVCWWHEWNFVSLAYKKRIRPISFEANYA